MGAMITFIFLQVGAKIDSDDTFLVMAMVCACAVLLLVLHSLAAYVFWLFIMCVYESVSQSFSRPHDAMWLKISVKAAMFESELLRHCAGDFLDII